MGIYVLRNHTRVTDTSWTNRSTWRGKVGKMSQAEVERFLAGNSLCRVGCLDEEGWSYVVPVWYQY